MLDRLTILRNAFRGFIVEDAISWESIRRSRTFESLDHKLARELMDGIESFNINSHHDILNKEQDLQSIGKLLSGRQLLWLLYDFMAMDSQKAHLMEI